MSAQIGRFAAVGTQVATKWNTNPAATALVKEVDENNSLFSLVMLLDLADATVWTIYRNFAWAFCFNVLGIPLAAGCFYLPYGVLLPPMFGGLAMACSSIIVVCSSLLLRNFKPTSWQESSLPSTPRRSL